MSVRAFIRQHRQTIDAVARSYGVTGRLNDNERHEWILNDEGLYRLARAMGVKTL